MATCVPETDYRESHKDPAKGETYDLSAHQGRYRSLVWAWEREQLTRVLDRFENDREIRLLDFACGTGRIIGHLQSRVTAAMGVDVSEAMLHVARRRVRQGEILQADLTRENVLGERRFNLITAFRFFLNAQPSLREEAIAALAAHLDDDGILVFNNHLQRLSLTHIAFVVSCWLRGRRFRRTAMSIREIETLVTRAGLEVVETAHWGVLPATDNRLPLPRSLLKRLEDWASRWRVFRPLAQNILVVCARPKPARPTDAHQATDLAGSLGAARRR